MEKIIIEVGSTVTKIDKYDGKKITHLCKKTIEFKKNYNKNNELLDEDINILINLIEELKKKYMNFYVFWTSIFRVLSKNQREKFLNEFYNYNYLNFN